MFGELGKDEKGWGLTTLGKCCELNPKRPRDISDELMVSFVPMPAVSEDGKIDCSDVKPYKEVRKGFTYFEENDVLFAKITPCMENGKGAVAKGLENEIGSGSTEFHVLRPIEGKSNPYWLYILTMFESFRVGARKVMTGTGGQLRVPIGYLKDYPIALPPIELQDCFEEIVHQSDKSKFVRFKSQFIEMFGDPIENSKGWKTIPLFETGKCKNGMNYSRKDSGVEIRCLGVADFQDNAVIDDMSVIPMISLNEKPNDDYFLRDGDIVFVRSNGNKALVGRCVVVYPGTETVVYSGFCIRYRKKTEELLTDYLLRFFKMDSVRLKMTARGANIQNLNQQTLASLNVPVPPKELQQTFSNFVHQVDKSK